MYKNTHVILLSISKHDITHHTNLFCYYKISNTDSSGEAGIHMVISITRNPK